jgi:hypothetical protein
MGWKDASEAQRFSFKKKGDQLTGKLLNIKQTKEYDSKVYTLMDSEGDLFYFFGCHKLDTVLTTLEGRYVQIVYKGKVKLKEGKTLRDFEINIWSEEDGSTPEGFDEDVPF